MSGICICLQMGKVGSSSIAASFDGVVQLHSWSPSVPIQYFSTRYRGTALGYLKQRLHWRRMFAKAKESVELARLNGEQIIIVVGVRDPIDRNISAFFQTFPNTINKDYDLGLAQQEFLAFGAHYTPIVWFDLEIRRNFGVDVFDFPFEKSQGYSVFQAQGATFLLYRIDVLDRVLPVIGELTGQHTFASSKVNSSDQKVIADLYTKFRATFVPPAGMVTDLYQSRYFRHFFSLEDQKW